MTTHTNIQDISLDELPATIRAFLAAHTVREADAALRTFTHDPVVVDQDETFSGTEEVSDFLRNAGAEFTYTTELVSARREDATHYVVVNHIEGDFPGGVADLHYRFTLTGDLISELRIG
ncbi:nuclear transport factor 2 family protein [Nocardioides KLBMP 9356]|uniref:Nuclear transport factor 2 family protein n=1 Tax=Nocardioides potassii TaxID=2911371 RepID=A0ABS9H500_9ACTN|nr:nuclear transport factor 2 family protein [Nocardioides potassii]MCF6376330.1 nuclear transport factor 2 family protein [Nocardioides potassii]